MSLTEKTAAELLALQAAGQATAAEIADAFLAAVRDREPKLQAFLHVDEADVRRQAAAVDAKRKAGRAARQARRACRSRSRTSSARKGVRPPARSKMLENFVPPYDAHVVERLRGRGRGADRQDEPGRVRDGLVHREQRVPGHPQPVGHRPHPRRLQRRQRRGGRRRARRRCRSAPTPAARSASRPACAASSGSSRPTAACRGTAWSRSPARSTRSARSPTTSPTPPCCWKSIAGHDRRDSTSVDRAGAGVHADARRAGEGR